MSDPRPNFRLADLDNQKCSTCKNSLTDSEECTYCMLGAADSSNTADGQRVNQNFVCDAFTA